MDLSYNTNTDSTLTEDSFQLFMMNSNDEEDHVKKKRTS